MNENDIKELLSFYKETQKEFEGGRMRGKSSLSILMKGFLEEEIKEDIEKGYDFKTIITLKEKKYDVEINYASAKSYFRRKKLSIVKVDSPKSEVSKAEKSQAELLEKKAAGLNQKKEEKGEEKSDSESKKPAGLDLRQLSTGK